MTFDLDMWHADQVHFSRIPHEFADIPESITCSFVFGCFVWG